MLFSNVRLEKGMGAKIERIETLQIEIAGTPIMTNSFVDALYLEKLGFRLSGVFPVTL
jgi:hypothetical protein